MTDSVFDARPWERHEGETVVECPSCGFCMCDVHEDMGGGYTCPLCGEVEARERLNRLYDALASIENFCELADEDLWPRIERVHQIATDTLNAERKLIREKAERGN